MKKSTASNPAPNFGVKSQLAKLLATENIRIEHRPGIPTAFFDIKNRLLALPVWTGISEDLYDMLILHETAHALDTPMEGWLEEIKRIARKHHKNTVTAKLAEASVKDFMNVIEDARIDKRQKRRYPGGRRNYINGMAELHDRDFFGLKKSGKDVNSLPFIDRANIYFKGGSTTMNINFDAKEKTYIKRMEDAENFDEVVKLTDELYEYSAKEQQQQPQSGKQKLKVVLTDGDGEGNDDIDPEDLKEFDVEIEDQRTGQAKDGNGKTTKAGDEEKSMSKGGQAKKDGKEGEGEGKDKGEGKGKPGDKKTAGDVNPYAHQVTETYDLTERTGPQEFIPKCVTEISAAEKIKEMVLDVDANYVYVNTPKFRLEHIVDDFSVVVPQMERSMNWVTEKDRNDRRNELRRWKNQEADTIAFMVKEFEMRKAADVHSRIQVAKTGVLDTNKIHGYKYIEDMFRRQAVIPEGKNHGFVMILDWSGSMQQDLRHTMKQLFSLVLFCKKAQIPFDVYLFRDPGGRDSNISSQWIREQNDLTFKSFKLRNILSSRMNAQMFTRALETLWFASYTAPTSDSMSGTPLNQAILVAHEIVNEFRKRNRVQIVSTIVLSDGGSDSCLGYVGQTNLATKKGGDRYFVRDHITGRIYPLPATPNGSYQQMTYLFNEMLKERTQSNLIGFYLYDGNYQNLSYHVEESALRDPKTEKQWNEDGFVTSKSAGYDEYHIMSVKKGGSGSKGLNVTGDMTSSAMVKAFTSFNKKKKVNRALLTNFITRISDFKAIKTKKNG